MGHTGLNIGEKRMINVSVYDIKNDRLIEYQVIANPPEYHRLRTAYCRGAIAAFQNKSSSNNPYEAKNGWGNTWNITWDNGYQDFTHGKIKILRMILKNESRFRQ